MKFGVRRRTIALVPPADEDVAWVFSEHGGSFSTASESARRQALAAYRAGKLVVGIIRRVDGDRRIGFVILLPASPGVFEFSIAIPDLAERDGFSALYASDAISRYMFDFVGIEAATWRIRSDNRRAEILARRIGYEPTSTSESGGHAYSLYVLDKATWAKRRRALEARSSEPPFVELRS